MKLPEFFTDSFQQLMEENEYKAFYEAFDGKRNFGIRVNTLKIQPEELLSLIDKQLEPIPWSSNGFYTEGESYGKHPAYHAGLYYIQEPSAMMPAQALAPEPGEKVLDLCAAPGGKTTAMGNQMLNEGLLVSNDISPKRVIVLAKNVELMGLTNSFIINEKPEKLKNIYIEFFDRILLDVPCSGEGMFRKDKEAVQSYSSQKIAEYVSIQRNIFDSAYAMLKPGGTMVYSTCTFNPHENEENIEFFIKNYDMEVDKLNPVGGFEPSRSAWIKTNDKQLDGGLRMWPHKARGEGHFVCRLKKKGIKPENKYHVTRTDYTSKEAENVAKIYRDFASENMNRFEEGVFHLKGSGLYLLPSYMEDIPPVRWYEAGLYLGECKNGRFEPSQALLMASKPKDFKRSIRFDRNDQSLFRYLRGETLFNKGSKGFGAVCYEDYPLGWVKQDGEILKNLYPKGWRMM